MKLLLALTLLTAGLASAQTTASFTRDQTQSCSNYCTAYSTDNPALTVTFANLTVASSGDPTPYKLTLGISGVSYSGTATADVWYTRGTNLTAGDGSETWVSNLAWTSRTTCTHSGRGQHCTTWRYVDSGTITM